MKHDQAHALLDLLGHKGQQRGGVRAHAAVGVGVAAREREASSEQREEEGVKTAHDVGLQRADGRRRFSGQEAAAISIQPPKVRVRARMSEAGHPQRLGWDAAQASAGQTGADAEHAARRTRRHRGRRIKAPRDAQRLDREVVWSPWTVRLQASLGDRPGLRARGMGGWDGWGERDGGGGERRPLRDDDGVDFRDAD